MKLTCRRSALIWTAFGLAIVSFASLEDPRYRLMYNASDSAPRGWYALVPEREFQVGMFVFARLPTRAEKLAAERGYLPLRVPLLKQIRAARGDFICAQDRVLTINGETAAQALKTDGNGRPLAQWTQCRLLEDDEVLLLGIDNHASFDSRYFGPVNVSSITGRAIPVWTW